MNITMAIENSCIQFPCSFPLKVMGLNNELFEPAVKTVFETFVKTGPITYAKQLSSNGKYVSITAMFTATSQEQLDALYRALNDHELVVMTL
jgi:putative lipoic acid-binding regulatory protein